MPPVFEYRYHCADGRVEVFRQSGDTPQARAVVEERLARYPQGFQDLFQHPDGTLQERPPGCRPRA
ncbi:MAG: hypothetical protein F4103_04440 [Boseongicola sp. SB0673_bin_14]|nr:hypothetical protein [Boseongicola sp. SB0673_bin_14]